MSARDVAPTDHVHPGDPVTVDRYTAGARINHWITATSLVLLALSGLALFSPSLYFLTELFGGGQWTRTIHPWIGVVLFFSFIGMFVRFWRLNLWERNDSVWMTKLRDVLANREEGDTALTEVGKYNAGQKMVFWSMSVLIIVLISSGVVIWDQYFSQSPRVEERRIAVRVHWVGAMVGMWVWITHFSAAIGGRATIGAMTRGLAPGGGAWNPPRKWWRELVPEKSGAQTPSATPAE